MTNGCGCSNAATASAGGQAVLPLTGILSPLIAGARATMPVGRSAEVAAPTLAATPEMQEAAQSEVFAGQVAGASTKPAAKTSGMTWVLIAGAAAAAFAAMV